MELEYFINCFLEVEPIRRGSNIWREMRNVGNTFATKEEAEKMLIKVKQVFNEKD